MKPLECNTNDLAPAAWPVLPSHCPPDLLVPVATRMQMLDHVESLKTAPGVLAKLQAKPDIPPGWEASYAIGDLLLAVDNWKASTLRNARPAFDDLVKACSALVAAAQPAA